MILPGILSSQISGHLISSSYYSIATATVTSGGATSITFSSIPQDYTHLQIRGIWQISGDPGLNFYINGDSTHTNYYAHGQFGNATPATGAYSNNPFLLYSNASGNYYESFVIDILDYTNTNKYRVSKSVFGESLNGSGGADKMTSLYKSTTAVTSLTIQNEYGITIQPNSQFALYGIK